MTSVPGATRYLNAATLANTKGVSPSTPSLLDQGSTTASILDAARNTLRAPGMGISSNARALTQQFLNRTSDINQMFSYGLGPNATLEGMKQQILALRSTLPASRLGPNAVDFEDLGDTVPPSSTNGTNVDTDA